VVCLPCAAPAEREDCSPKCPAQRNEGGALFEVGGIDREFYLERLEGFLPTRLIDIHTHVGLDQFKSKQNEECLRSVTWPRRVALDSSIEDLMETYELIFPGHKVTPLIFGSTSALADDIQGGNPHRVFRPVLWTWSGSVT
jgi:hypothetical protein